MDFQAIRKEYENQGIDEANLPQSPMELFRQWYQLALDKCPGDWFEPNVTALATSDLQGHVTNRYVLIKGVGEDGIQFFTNYDSAKAQQMSANPHASAALHWPYLGRQVRFDGTVEKTSREISEQYFHSRPRGAQLGAAASPQSSTISARDELDQAKKQLEQQCQDGPVPLPENWGGYLLKPHRIEFWQGRSDRLHDRIVYQFETQWMRSRLAP